MPTGNFPAQLAQMIQNARPQPVNVRSGVQYLGPVKAHDTVGPDIGGSLEAIGDAIYEVRQRRVKEAEEFYKSVSQFQGDDRAAWDAIKAEPRIQERIERLRKSRPEYFREVSPGVWDVMPSTGAKQGYRKGEAEIETEAAKGQNIRHTTRRGERMLGADVRKAEAEATSAEVEAEVSKLTKEQQVLYRDLVNRGLKAETALKGAQEANVKADTGLVKEKTTTEQMMRMPELQRTRAQTDLLREQVQGQAAETNRINQMLPYEQRYRDAAAAASIANAKADLDRIGRDTDKLKATARNASVKELLDVRAQAEKAQVDSIKATGNMPLDPFQYTADHVKATKAMISGFGPITMVTGIDDKGQEQVANVPGAIEDPAGRYWVWKSLEKTYDTFEQMWQAGDGDSLGKASQLRDMAYQMYQSTYGQIKDQKVMGLLNPMPNVEGYGGDGQAVNDVFTKILTMILTLDQLEPPGSPNKLQVNDPIHQIADKLGIQPLPPTPGSMWGLFGNKQGVKQ